MANPDPQYEAWGWQPRPTSAGLTYIDMCGRRPRVAPEAVEAFTAMNDALLATGYENPCDWTGSYKYRVVAGTNQLSRHAYALAIDLDYGGDTDGDGDPTIDRNPHLHRKVVESDYGNTIQLLRHQVDAVLAIRTNSGKQAIRWLGDINGDSMHFDINCSPEDLATGIAPMGRFEDVPESNPFHDDIEWLADTGVTLGSNPPDNTLFNPKGTVTREQMAAFMHRYDTYLSSKGST